MLPLGEPVFEHWRRLRTFYLVGIAYKNGARSLRIVADQLWQQDLAKALPNKIPTSKGALSELLVDLAQYVFSPHFKVPYMVLLAFPKGEGTAGVLSADGWRAWEATREFLERFNLIPGLD